VAHALALQSLSGDELDRRLVEPREAMRRAYRRGVEAPRADFLEAVAIVCELARRTVGMTPYEVQVQATITLLDGCAAQMNAGEGKTLSVALAAALLTAAHFHYFLSGHQYLAEIVAETRQSNPFFKGLLDLALKAGISVYDIPPLIICTRCHVSPLSSCPLRRLLVVAIDANSTLAPVQLNRSAAK
jgi:preprotein translocase subunit SecA